MLFLPKFAMPASSSHLSFALIEIVLINLNTSRPLLLNNERHNLSKNKIYKMVITMYFIDTVTYFYIYYTVLIVTDTYCSMCLYRILTKEC